MSETFSYSANGVMLEGQLFAPPKGHGQPAVVLFGDVYGLGDMVKRRAEMVCELGYMALAADLYGGGACAASREEALHYAEPLLADPQLLRARGRAAITALALDPRVDAGRIVLFGYCFGGFAALEATRDGCSIAGAVSFHGGLETRIPASPGAIGSPVLVLTGGDDPMVPPAQIHAFEDEMRAAGADWQVVTYGGAKHAFTVPGADALGRPGVGYDARADARSWRAAVDFLLERFEAARSQPSTVLRST